MTEDEGASARWRRAAFPLSTADSTQRPLPLSPTPWSTARLDTVMLYKPQSLGTAVFHRGSLTAHWKLPRCNRSMSAAPPSTVRLCHRSFACWLARSVRPIRPLSLPFHITPPHNKESQARSARKQQCPRQTSNSRCSDVPGRALISGAIGYATPSGPGPGTQGWCFSSTSCAPLVMRSSREEAPRGALTKAPWPWETTWKPATHQAATSATPSFRQSGAAVTPGHQAHQTPCRAMIGPLPQPKIAPPAATTLDEWWLQPCGRLTCGARLPASRFVPAIRILSQFCTFHECDGDALAPSLQDCGSCRDLVRTASRCCPALQLSSLAHRCTTWVAWARQQRSSPAQRSNSRAAQLP